MGQHQQFKGPRVPGVKSRLRLHYQGHVIIEPIRRFADSNGLTINEAHQLLADWLRDGHIVARDDGGFDVIRWQRRRQGASRVGSK